MTCAFVGLGSNLGDSAAIVQAALQSLDRIQRTRLLRASALYLTPPWGTTDQAHFVNAVAQIETALTARELLNELLAIEERAGRTRTATRWGPRLLDLDVLLFGDAHIDETGLQVPHPRLGERAFALVPLAELAPDLLVPGQGRVRELLARVDATPVRLHHAAIP